MTERTITVLVVEDTPVAAEIIDQLLRAAGGFAVSMASCGADALAMIDRTSFDLAIVDLSLPDTTGVELLEALRGRSPRTRLVVCSAHEPSSDLVSLARDAADSIVPKAELPRSMQLLRNLCREAAAPPLEETA